MYPGPGVSPDWLTRHRYDLPNLCRVGPRSWRVEGVWDEARGAATGAGGESKRGIRGRGRGFGGFGEGPKRGVDVALPAQFRRGCPSDIPLGFGTGHGERGDKTGEKGMEEEAEEEEERPCLTPSVQERAPHPLPHPYPTSPNHPQPSSPVWLFIRSTSSASLHTNSPLRQPWTWAKSRAGLNQRQVGPAWWAAFMRGQESTPAPRAGALEGVWGQVNPCMHVKALWQICFKKFILYYFTKLY